MTGLCVVFSVISSLASVYPVAVNVHGLRQIVYGRLKVLGTHPTDYQARVQRLVQFYLARLLVVTEGTREYVVERSRHLFLRWSLPLRFPSSHILKIILYFDLWAWF